MPPTTADYLAIDLGASSGRAVLGAFDGSRLSLRELHRFQNGPISLPTGLHWNTPRLFEEILHALSLAAREGKARLAGIGIDTWGVDYGLLSARGQLLGLPHHYRDPRTATAMEATLARIPRERIYTRTGIQFMTLNTIYQLAAELRAADSLLPAAHRLLFTPDLLHYWLTGIQHSERSIASTSQLLDTATGTWATDLVDALGLPSSIFPPIAEPGTPIGPLLPALADQTGIREARIIAPASHDTASAVAAVPATGTDWAYISSGTWSLVGRELPVPIRTPEAMAANFTNECGALGAIRFHKNVAGLWLLQECQRAWTAQGRRYTFESLCQTAAAATPLKALIDPDHPPFSEFCDMPARIRSYCEDTGQPPPETDGALARCILESLALKSRLVIDALEALTGPVSTIHIIGGGVQNALLCQFTADACNRPVLAGPVEATAMGNILTQALAPTGGCKVSSLADIRAIVRASTITARYEPRHTSRWDAACARLASLRPPDPQPQKRR